MTLSPRRPLFVVAAAVLGVLTLAGCARDAESAPTEPSSPAASAAATPAATPTETPAPPEHTLAFGGDCANVLGADGLTELLGEGASPIEMAGWPDTAVGTLGGIDCRWMADSARGTDGPGSLTLQVYPMGSVPVELRDEVASTRCDPSYDALICRQGRAAADVWLIASILGGMDGSPAAEEEWFLDQVLDLAERRVGTFPAPQRLAAQDTWWKTNTDCEELGQRMGLEELMGQGYRTGWWEGNPEEQWEFRLAASQGVESLCQWFPDYGQAGAADQALGITTLRSFPGGAWDDALFVGGEPIEVDGAERAVRREHDIVASDGENVVSVSRISDIATAEDFLARFLRTQQD